MQRKPQSSSGAVRIAAFGVVCWVAGHITGRYSVSSGPPPVVAVPRGFPKVARQPQRTPTPPAPSEPPTASPTDSPRGEQNEAEKQEDAGTAGGREEEEPAAVECLDSRGARVRVAGAGIAAAQRYETPHSTAALKALQERHLSAASLSPAEIEQLPMYSYTFSHKALAGGRKRLICPPWVEAEDKLQIPLRHLPRKKPTSVDQKYDRRAVNCNFGGIWHRVGLDDHRAILGVISKLLGVKRGETVFDWGSGCGHKLRFLHDELGVNGFGLDVSELSVRYALENTTKDNHFCRANGVRTKEWMPENYFDHALSFGSVYHVYNRTTFCSVLRDMVRVVRPGGRIYNGWTENAEFRRRDVAPCLRDLPVTHQIVEEKRAFSHVQVFPLKSQQQIPNTYSLVIHKKAATTARYWDYVPVVCGKFSCNETSYPS
eukprot:TRINITY_DN26773_c0_g1_i1.p1 TRINITY_DN26773_c0_g1~~TRINITY_DN26773_c0_g1_i1.p1  ORF type:complete len:430 (+),score=52.60 TRINITY_DN26773_c0_g1_i1:69-1358(+)